MADPLSVAASVVGLLAAGAKLASLLSETASLADAPSSAQAVLTEMREIYAALQYLQQFLNGLMNVPAGRQQYILVEHLEGTLTGCVTTYDELEVFIDELKIVPSDMGVLDRFKWARKEEGCCEYRPTAPKPQIVAKSYAHNLAMYHEFRNPTIRGEVMQPSRARGQPK
ncbi:hypothetical protein BGZ57DRAFT_896726 [Hyaloscypha finlandica]|nr:hypothetical protein BGZ57DRAFT_896726 [Hyaloscypha finlandica]